MIEGTGTGGTENRGRCPGFPIPNPAQFTLTPPHRARILRALEYLKLPYERGVHADPQARDLAGTPTMWALWRTT